MFDLVLGTHNAKKLIELRLMLPAERIQLTSLAEVANAIEVEEDGTTFGENARKKASAQAIHLGRWVLGEDSGLSVDALGGRPGVHSARYAGRHGDDEANNELLLKELAKVPLEQRGAQYNSHLALADPTGQIRLEASGICRGRIGTERAGKGGFGYDPLFIIPEYHRTFGELDLAVKRALSHRSRALRKFIPQLVLLVDSHTA